MNLRAKNSTRLRILAVLPALVWQCVFLLVPIFLIAMNSFLPLDSQAPTEMTNSLTLHHYARALSAPFDHLIINSVWLSFKAAVSCVLLGFPVAWFISRRQGRWRGLWLAVFLFPFLLNFLVRIYAWYVLLRPTGWVTTALRALGMQDSLLSSPAGVMVGLVYGYLPFVVLPLYAVLDKLDDNLLWAARDLGAGQIRILVHVIMRHLLPALVAGFLLAIAVSIDDFYVSYFGAVGGSGFQTLPLYLWNLQARHGLTPEINVIATLLLTVSALFVLGSFVIEGSGAGERLEH